MADDRIDPKLALALAALEAIPVALQAFNEVVALANATAESLRRMQAEGREPTEAEWVALNVTVHNLRARLRA